MNFLAHLYLAEPAPEAWIGSIMPDLVRPRRIPPDLPGATIAAIIQHRRIDAFTDTHPVVAASKDRIRPRHGRYSAILIDVFYDHFLAADWERWHPLPLADFVARVYAAFRSYAHLLPDSMRYPVDLLLAEDWLSAYASVAGIRTVLARMSRRLSQRFARTVDLAGAADDLAALHGELAGDFADYFPQLVRFVRGGA